MTDPVAVGAHKNAFAGLDPSALDAAKETAEREVLGGGVAMVEFERPDSA